MGKEGRRGKAEEKGGSNECEVDGEPIELERRIEKREYENSDGEREEREERGGKESGLQMEDRIINGGGKYDGERIGFGGWASTW